MITYYRKITPIKIFWLFFFVLYNCGSEPDASFPVEPGLESFSLTVNGFERSYLAYIPTGLTNNDNIPVVVMFHGGGGNALNTVESTGWDKKAEEEKFIVLFPNALPEDPEMPASFTENPQTWNDGSGRFASGDQNNADVQFIELMLDDIENKIDAIDANSLFLTGFSNGASMAFRAGIELSEQIKAIAPVAGSLWIEEPKLEKPVALIYITGEVDPLNPIDGGLPRFANGTPHSDLPKPPVMSFINTWSSLLNCPSEENNIESPDGVTAIEFAPCLSNSRVQFYKVDDLGHVWPGGTTQVPRFLVGPASNKLQANDVIWDFFQALIKDQ